MERITMSIDEKLAQEFDMLIRARGYTSRSEAMRDLLRREVEANRPPDDPKAQCVASLSYVYNHHERKLAERLVEAQHAQHELVVAAMHVHLDHEHCLETVALKGPSVAVVGLAQRTEAERGVQHLALNLITVDNSHTVSRARGHRYRHQHGHLHLMPRG